MLKNKAVAAGRNDSVMLQNFGGAEHEAPACFEVSLLDVSPRPWVNAAITYALFFVVPSSA